MKDKYVVEKFLTLEEILSSCYSWCLVGERDLVIGEWNTLYLYTAELVQNKEC